MQHFDVRFVAGKRRTDDHVFRGHAALFQNRRRLQQELLPFADELDAPDAPDDRLRAEPVGRAKFCPRLRVVERELRQLKTVMHDRRAKRGGELPGDRP